MKSFDGAEMIAIERRRQFAQEGFTAEHDDEHGELQLLDAAVCYALRAGCQLADVDSLSESIGRIWPWGWEWWKPTDDPVRNLVKAGALIAAEIDRLQRKRERDGQH